MTDITFAISITVTTVICCYSPFYVALLMVAAAWLIATIYNVAGNMPIVYTAHGTCYMMVYESKAAKQAKGMIGVSLVYFIPIFTLVYCYSRMAYALRTTVNNPS